MIDGQRVHLYDWDKEVARGKAVHGGTADVHFQVKAGPHTVGVTFLATQLAPSQDLDEHFLQKHHRDGRSAGLQVLSACRQDGDSGPVQAGRRQRFAQREKDFCLPSGECIRGNGLREEDCRYPGAACVPPSR